jgi:hypothetical protein
MYTVEIIPTIIQVLLPVIIKILQKNSCGAPAIFKCGNDLKQYGNSM